MNRLPPPVGDRAGWPWTAPSASAGDGAPTAADQAATWPKITVVTPSYNQAAFLEETIRSVLLQGYPNLEYIVVDGGSTDGSVEIIRKYAPWITHWVSEKDRGQSHAINKGFERSTGEILCWLNSDDTFAPGTLRRAARALGGRRAPAWFVGATEVVDAVGAHVKVQTPGRPSRRRMLQWGRNWFPQQSTFWNRPMWERAGPVREELYYFMDLALWVEMIGHAAPETTDEVLSTYRFHEDAKCKTTGSEDRSVQESTRFWLDYLAGTPARAAERVRSGPSGVWDELVFAGDILRRMTRRKRSLAQLAQARLAPKAPAGRTPEAAAPAAAPAAAATAAPANADRDAKASAGARVCVVTDVLPPAHSGAALAGFRHAARLARRAPGRAILVGGAPPDGAPAAGDATLPVYPVPRWTPHVAYRASRAGWVLTDLMAAVEYAARLWPLLSRLRDRFDLVLLFGGAMWLNLLAIPVARLLGKPVVLEMSLLGSDDPDAVRRSGGLKQMLNPRSLQFALYRQADVFVSKSHVLTDAYLDAGMPRERLVQIPYPVDVDRYRPASADERAALRKSLGLPEAGTAVLFVGGVTPRKGVHWLVEAFERVAAEAPDAYLVVAGPSHKYDPAYARALHAAAEAPALRGRVHFVDRVVENVDEYMRAADVFAFPTTREGLPIVVLEAMACGLAVAASDIPEIARSEIRDGVEGVLFPVGDVDALSRHLTTLLADPERRSALGAAARRRALDEFSTDTVDAAYERLYELVSRRPVGDVADAFART